jgi:hypothetical protein
MDPLSITLSIIALLNLTKDVVLYIKEAKDASDERKKFVRETASLSGMLNTLLDFINEEDQNSPWLYAVSDLIARDGIFDQYTLALQLLKNKIAPKAGVRKLGQALLWKHVKEDICSLLSQIERLNILVGIALDLDHMLVHYYAEDTPRS